jgi:hypothetical protein
MVTVGSLLEELGRPPRDVCLDWAWQVRGMFEDRTRQGSAATIPMTWYHLELSELGELKLCDGDVSNLSPDTILQQLVVWSTHELSGSKDEILNEVNSIDEVFGLLSELTLESPVQANSATTRIAETIRSKSVEPTETGQRKSTRPAQIRRHHGTWTDYVVANKRFLAITIVPTFVFVLLCAMWLMRKERKETDVKVMGATTEGEFPSISTTEKNKDQLKNRSVRDSQQFDVKEEPPVERATLSLGILPVPQVSNSVNEQQAIGRLAQPDGKLLPPAVESFLGDIDGGRDSTLAADNVPKDAMDNSDNGDAIVQQTNNSPEEEAVGADVLTELTSVSRSATSMASESELEVAAPADEERLAEPLVILTTPAVQIQKLPSNLEQRPRKPVWRIALVVDDGFVVTPREIQSLMDRQTATWTITSEDAKPPRTSIVVQVQMSGGRQAALKWKIVATSEDLPNISIPLGDELLQPVQDRLRLLTQSATQETERLKQLAASGVPGDVRASLNKQRSQWEAQARLSARLLTFVASAQQVDDWLHNRIAVFAELRDGNEPHSPITVQFGDLQEWAKTLPNKVTGSGHETSQTAPAPQ